MRPLKDEHTPHLGIGSQIELNRTKCVPNDARHSILPKFRLTEEIRVSTPVSARSTP